MLGRTACHENARAGVSALARIFAGRCSRKIAAFCLALAAAGVGSAHAADIQNIDLGKNAQVWFAEDHTVPMVAFNISLPAGAAYDPPGKAGLASFTGALIDEGAGNLDSKAFHEALANKAIGFSARADRDYLVISVTTMSENAPEAMRLWPSKAVAVQPGLSCGDMALVRVKSAAYFARVKIIVNNTRAKYMPSAGTGCRASGAAAGLSD